jgi:AcrR family transcriptional regulator
MSDNALRLRGTRRAPRPAGKAARISSLAVEDVQRTRLLSATLRECAAGGSAELTVAGVVGAAGVSRRTFYELFPDVRSCLLTLIHERLEIAEALVCEACEQQESWSERVRVGLGALLAHFEHEPDVARVLVLETLRAGPEAAALRRATVARLVASLDAAGASAPPSAAVCSLSGHAAVAAVLGIVQDRLSAQAQPRLSALLNELMCVIVVHYQGSAAARRQLRRAPSAAAMSPIRRREDSFRPLPMRLTYRTVRVLRAIGQQPGASNRQIGIAAGIEDQGQASKMLTRLQRLGLIENRRAAREMYGANAWRLTAAGAAVEQEIAARDPLSSASRRSP